MCIYFLPTVTKKQYFYWKKKLSFPEDDRHKIKNCIKWQKKVSFLYNSHQYMFINQPSMAQALRCQIIKGIHGNSTTSKSQSLHVPSFCTTKSNYTFLRQHVQWQRVNSLWAKYYPKVNRAQKHQKHLCSFSFSWILGPKPCESPLSKTCF